jgi:hypothetical protein
MTFGSKPVAEQTESSNRRDAGKWQRQLAVAEKEFRKFWERGRKVNKKYLAETDSTSLGGSGQGGDQFNLFWSNVGVLKASLYANPPKPLVKREFDDYQDDEARVAAVMMERLLRQGFEKPESDMNVAFYATVEDRLLPGLGQIWLRYEPEIETYEVQPAVMDSKGREIKKAVSAEQIVNERVITDYVYWEDFICSPARTWDEVWWVGRRVWMTKQEFESRFGKVHSKLVTWTKKEPNKYGERVTPDSMGVEKTEVFEIWCKTSKSVHWVSRSCEYELDTQGDPLELDGFFPCPKPLLATHTTSNFIPKADYLMVQSQYRRLDNLTYRIGMLEDAIQASGVYDKSNPELAQILSGNSNKMIPVDNWAMFAEKGGMKGVVDWFPLEMIVNALDKLRELKGEAKIELYELTGISDIMRGVTSPRETLGAQELKSQYSSVRLQYLQGEVAYFIQNGLRIKAEIISKHFQPETIMRNSLIELTPDAEYAQAAVQILKDEWSRCYRIQVFADTLAIPDYNAERAGRTEFIGAAGQFISQIVPLVQMEPGAGPFLMQILQWGVAAFRSAQSIEGVFDKAITAMNEKLKQPAPPPPPDPAMVKAEAEVKKAQAMVQLEQQKTANAAQADAAKTQADIAAQQQKTQADVQAVAIKTNADVQATRAKTAAAVESTRIKTQAQIEASRAKMAAQPKAKSNGK